jgi:hypothetical protein
MTTGNRWPQAGDLAVDVAATARGRDKLGPVVTIKEVADRGILTSAGERYSWHGLRPAGRPNSAHELMPVTADRVLVAKGREHLAALVAVVINLSDLDHRTPESVIVALAQVITTAHESRVALLALMVEASRAEQESNR